MTFVPESAAAPHMALFGAKRYFKRSNDKCNPLEHFDIADMFGRRQKAAFEVTYTISRGSSGSIMQGRETGIEARIGVAIQSIGRASAEAPYVRLRVSSPYVIGQSGWSACRQTHACN